MSSLAAAARLVSRARRRLALTRAVDLAATGALAGALLAAAVVGARWWLASEGPTASLLAAPLVGAIVGGALAWLRSPAPERAALALDRAAGSHEAFVSALTAVDADPAFRELSAAYALRALADRPLGRLLPVAVPRRAAPALASIALLAALSVVAGAPGEGDARAAAAVVLPVDGAAGGGGGGRGGGEPGGDATRLGSTAVPVQRDGAGSSVEAAPPAVADLPALPRAEVERLASDLAARGVEAGAAALQALRDGDRERAEELLRAALTTSTDPGDGAMAGPTGSDPGSRSGSTSGAPGAVAPGAWSAGAWPLRYDREVRAWLRRQAATNGGDGARTEER